MTELVLTGRGGVVTSVALVPARTLAESVTCLEGHAWATVIALLMRRPITWPIVLRSSQPWDVQLAPGFYDFDRGSGAVGIETTIQVGDPQIFRFAARQPWDIEQSCILTDGGHRLLMHFAYHPKCGFAVRRICLELPQLLPLLEMAITRSSDMPPIPVSISGEA